MAHTVVLRRVQHKKSGGWSAVDVTKLFIAIPTEEVGMQSHGSLSWTQVLWCNVELHVTKLHKTAIDFLLMHDTLSTKLVVI